MPHDPVADFTAALRQVVGPGSAPLHAPDLQGKEREYLIECIDSTYVSSVGPFVDRFERELEKFTGARHAIAVANGTAALHVALILAGVKADDEVLVPALTFVATANAVRYCHAHPHFVDIDPLNLGVDPRALRAYLETTAVIEDGRCINRNTRRVIRALVPMHAFGHPAALEELCAVAKDFQLELVEDAAESLGSSYHGAHTGTFGRLGVLSFNGNKIITTGGGGAILTNDSALAKHAKHLTTTAKLPHRWEYVHDEVGYNYRMPNLNAAMGCAQIERLPALLQAKRKLYSAYRTAFSGLPWAHIVAEPPGCHSNYWLQTVILAPEAAHLRDAILDATNQAGIMTRPAWRLLHRLPPYSACPRMRLSQSELVEAALINIPSSAALAASLPA